MRTFLICLALLPCVARCAVTQIALQATNFVLQSPWTYSTSSDSPEGAWVAPLATFSSISATVSLGQTIPAGNYSLFAKFLDYDIHHSNTWVLAGVTSPLNIFDDRDDATIYWSTNVSLHISSSATNVIFNLFRGSVANDARLFAIYITSDTNEVVLRDDRALAFNYVSATDTNVTPGNLVPNSSFEGGISRFWRVLTSAGLSSDPALSARRFTLQDCWVTNQGVHGSCAMRLPADTNGTVAVAESNPILVASNRAHTFSLYAKSSAGNNRVTIQIHSMFTAPPAHTETFFTNISTTVGTSWTRIALTNFTLPKYPDTEYWIHIETRQDGGTGGGDYTYLDAMQLEEGPAATAYAPKAPYEFGMTLNIPTQIIWTNDTATLSVRAYNDSNGSLTKQLAVRSYNWTNNLSWSTSTNLTATSSNFATAVLTVPTTELGHFRCSLTVTGQDTPDELAWIVIAPPVTTNADTASYFGAHINADSNALARAQRLGVKWQRGLSLGRIRWSETQPTSNTFVWPSLNVYTNYGISIMANLGEDTPSWISPATGNTNYFGNFVTNAVSNYLGIVKAYEIWNEPDQDQGEVPNASHYAELAKQAATAIRALDPTAIVVAGGGVQTLNYITNYWAHMAALNVTNKIDAMSVHEYPPSENNAITIHNGFTNVPIWNTESGMTDKGAYTFAQTPFRSAGHYVVSWKSGDPIYDSYFGNAEFQARNFLTCVAYGETKQFYYDDGQRNISTSDFDSRQFTALDYDDSERPKGAMLAALWRLLDKSTGQGSVSISNANVTALAFSRSGTPLIAFWSLTNVSAVLFPSVTTNDMRVFDLMGNGAKPSALTLTVSRMPYIVEGQGSVTLSNLCHAFSNAVVVGTPDILPPKITLDSAPQTSKTNLPTVFRWHAIDANTTPDESHIDGIVYRYSLDGGTFSAWSGDTWVTYEGLSGAHTIEVQARDAAGNIASTAGTVTTNVPPVAGGIVQLKGRMRIKK